jgi:hypothetical protein
MSSGSKTAVDDSKEPLLMTISIVVKGSMRVGCKGCMKVKLHVKVQYWYYKSLELKHNHPLHLDARMVCYMQPHKRMENGVKNLINVMTQARVEHQAQMHVMSELHGVREN